jgi:hypothetical protein
MHGPRNKKGVRPVDQWQDPVNTVMKFRVPCKDGKILGPAKGLFLLQEGFFSSSFFFFFFFFFFFLRRYNSKEVLAFSTNSFNL